MAREYFCAYHSYLDNMEELSDAECGRLFKACILYDKTGVAQELRGNEKFVFPGIRAQIDRDRESYQRKCEQNKANRSSTTVNDRQRPSTKSTKEKEKEKENIKERLPNGNPKKSIPPSLEEVAAYCEERGNGIDAESFVDFYTARGWTYGKNQQMKDWRAAVRTWEKRRTQEQPKEVDRYADLI
jgi:hypothetical protein